MSLDEALNTNPYDPTEGNESAYVRYLRYNVDGFYDLDSQVVKDIWKRRMHDLATVGEVQTT